MSYEFPSIASGPATPITGCYHPVWCDADLYPEGTRIVCLLPPGYTPWNDLVGEIITLTNDAPGRALRLLLTEWEIQGARFQVLERLL